MGKIDIKSIRNDINDSLELIQKAKVLPFFQQLDFNSTLNDRNRNLKTFKITDKNSLEKLKVPKEPGFYIIFSNIELENNNCTAVFDDIDTIKAIYRGEADNVHLRLKSHLFNEHYKEDFEKDEKESNFYSTTLKIDGSKVNIDKKPFDEHEWYVFYIAAPKSNQNVRNMYEASFDQVFGKPKCSNERERSESNAH